MKKTLAILLVAILAIASVVGVTAASAQGVKTEDSTSGLCEIIESKADASAYASTQSSDLYEIIEFTSPDKTVYSLTEDVCTQYTKVDDEIVEIPAVDFDGTGMSMTIRNKVTGNTETYTYEYRMMEDEGVETRIHRYLAFEFFPEEGEVLTEGEYAVRVICISESGDYVCIDIPFTLVA